jgi:hypothetical protein
VTGNDLLLTAVLGALAGLVAGLVVLLADLGGDGLVVVGTAAVAVGVLIDGEVRRRLGRRKRGPVH